MLLKCLVPVRYDSSNFSYSSESLVFCAWFRIMHEVVTNSKLDERERHLSRTLALILSSQLHLLEHHNA
jgi:hypothetical protein